MNSTSIAAVSYTPSSMTLDVDFVRGARYRYFNVPPLAYVAFLAAPSKGRFFNAAIRNQYPHQRA